MVMKFHKFYLIFLAFTVFYCQSSQKKTDSSAEIPITNKVAEDYFLKEPGEDEVLRVFVSSDEYILRQIGFENSILIVTGNSGQNAMSEEVGGYDLVDLFTEAVYKVELFKDSGLISHIRPVKPSRISELNKIIIDDITRLKFKFAKDDQVEPLTFKVRYGVHLRKKKSREEIRKILKDNVRE
jgi:hypothetical protein